jgi:uncharacterized membrane protein
MPCTNCETFGQLTDEKESCCFECKDFSAARYAHRIMEALDTGNFEADEDLMADFNKYVNHKFVPTVKRQTATISDRIALWIVQRAGTMNFTYACFIMVTIPLLWNNPKVMSVVQYLSSAYLQLLFLPLILVAGNLQQRRAELREESSYRITIKQDIQIEWLSWKLDKLKVQVAKLKGE